MTIPATIPAMRQRFEHIEKAALEISYDNGGINRDCTEAAMLGELRTWLAGRAYDPDRLAVIDAWLGSLDDDELMTVCTGGGHGDARHPVARAGGHRRSARGDIRERGVGQRTDPREG